MRNEDNSKAEISGTVKEGGHLLISEVKGEWAYVTFHDEEGLFFGGWVQYKYLISLNSRIMKGRRIAL